MGQLQLYKLNRDVNHELFSCGVESIDDMVYRSYYTTLLQHAYAYVISAQGIALGYYMFNFKKIQLDECPEEISDYRELMEDCISVHIKYIAINEKYQKRGIGRVVMKIIIDDVMELSNKWPVRLITLDAIPDKYKWYEKIGFKVWDKKQIDRCEYTIPMYMDCLKDAKIVEEYVEKQGV